MARDAKVFSAGVTANVVVAAATETVVATVAGIVMGRPDVRVDLVGYAAGLGVAATTEVILRLRRDSLTGTEVTDPARMRVPGAVEASGSTAGVEDRGELSGVTYVLTIEPVGGQLTLTLAALTALVR